jgi:hypothetical protein
MAMDVEDDGGEAEVKDKWVMMVSDVSAVPAPDYSAVGDFHVR